MGDKISRVELLERQDSAVGDHYLSLSVTVVGLGLAAAAAALASLIAQFSSLGPNRLILVLLWLAGLLSIAVAYAGPMVGAFALPRSVPVILDLLPPLGLGVSEFLIFAVFIPTFKPTTNITRTLLIWFAAMVLFGLCALVVIMRARFLFRASRSSYGDDVLPAVDSYTDYMTFSIGGPAGLTIISVVGIVAWLAKPERWEPIACAVLVIVDLLFGLWFHDVQAKPWQSLLAGNEGSEPPRIIRRPMNRIRERRLSEATPQQAVPR
jgi:hypothetical protein